jgi:hypothetical protein
VQLRVQRRDDLCRDNQFFSAHHGRKLRDQRVRRFVRVNGGRCIPRELRRRDRVRWAWVRERDCRRRDQRVREAARVVRRDDRDRGMCREESRKAR